MQGLMLSLLLAFSIPLLASNSSLSNDLTSVQVVDADTINKGRTSFYYNGQIVIDPLKIVNADEPVKVCAIVIHYELRENEVLTYERTQYMAHDHYFATEHFFRDGEGHQVKLKCDHKGFKKVSIDSFRQHLKDLICFDCHTVSQ